jgi:hypothetical protein
MSLLSHPCVGEVFLIARPVCSESLFLRRCRRGRTHHPAGMERRGGDDGVKGIWASMQANSRPIGRGGTQRWPDWDHPGDSPTGGADKPARWKGSSSLRPLRKQGSRIGDTFCIVSRNPLLGGSSFQDFGKVAGQSKPVP